MEKNDPLTYQYFSQWYMKFDDDNIKIDVKNPINMGNKKITNLKEGTDNNDAISKHQLQTGLSSKADKTELNDYILKSGLSSNLDMKNNKIVNLKTAISGNDAVNFTQ